MRNFRFRLDPVMRLKEYQIDRIEEEIARIEGEIQRLLREIEEGRAAVETMRRRLMEEIGDDQLIQVERELDLYTQFMTREEIRKFGEIERYKKEKEKRRQELIKLYQDKKVLERLKERRHTEWEAEILKEDSAVMDEIGTQRFIRRDREFGGVILYLLVPLVLVAAVAAAGFYTGMIKKEMLNQIPFLSPAPVSATSTIQAPTETVKEEYLTLEQLIGNPDTPMPVLLQNISERLDQMKKKEQELAEWENQLKSKQALFEQQQNTLAGLTKEASDNLIAYQDMKRQIEQNKKSESSKYEEEIATTLSSAKGKEIATLMTNLYNPPAEKAEELRLKTEEQTLKTEETQLRQQEQQLLDAQKQSGTLDEKGLSDVRAKLLANQTKFTENQTKKAVVQEKIRDSQLLLLKILHRFQSRGRKDLIVALGKSNPDVAAKIVADFSKTTSDELNKVKPTPTPIPTLEQTEKSTAPAAAG